MRYYVTSMPEDWRQIYWYVNRDPDGFWDIRDIEQDGKIVRSCRSPEEASAICEAMNDGSWFVESPDAR